MKLKIEKEIIDFKKMNLSTINKRRNWNWFFYNSFLLEI